MEKNNFQFKTYLSEQVPLEKLYCFLEENYLSVLYAKEYLEWFFSGEGSLCVEEDDEGNFIAVATASVFSLIFINKEYPILHGGPICVKKDFRKQFNSFNSLWKFRDVHLMEGFNVERRSY